jgi:hypothetical protein
MQAAINTAAEENVEFLPQEEQPVTFQIAMVGRDGLVVGSDRLGQNMGRDQTANPKYRKPLISGSTRLVPTIHLPVLRQVVQWLQMWRAELSTSAIHSLLLGAYRSKVGNWRSFRLRKLSHYRI